MEKRVTAKKRSANWASVLAESTRRLEELRARLERERAGVQVWLWHRARFIVRRSRGVEVLERVAQSDPEPYNVLDHPNLYLELANLDEADVSSVESFAKSYGLLGLGGWYWALQYGGLTQRRVPPDFRAGSEDATSRTVPLTPEGFLRTYYPLSSARKEALDTRLLEAERSWPEAEPVEQVRGEVRRMRAAVALHAAQAMELTEHNVGEWIQYQQLWSMGQDEWALFPTGGHRQHLDTSPLPAHIDSLLSSGQVSPKPLTLEDVSVWQEHDRHQLAFLLSQALQNVVWSPNPRRNWEHTYQPGPPSLMPALYLQLAMQYAKKRPTRLCQNEPCNKLFAPSRLDKKYCGTECKNAQMQRVWRRTHHKGGK